MFCKKDSNLLLERKYNGLLKEDLHSWEKFIMHASQIKKWKRIQPNFQSFLSNFKICNFMSEEEFSNLYLMKIQISLPWWAGYVCIILPFVGSRHVCIILPHNRPWCMILPFGGLLIYDWTLPLSRSYMYVSRFRLLVGSWCMMNNASW